MEERSNNKDGITKTGDFSWEAIKKLRNSKIIYIEVQSNKETVQQERTKLSVVEMRRQYVARSKKYLVKTTLKVRLKIL